MGQSKVVQGILATVKPTRKTRLVNRIWEDIEALRAADLTYKQIAALLPSKFGLNLTYRQFMSAVWLVREGRKPKTRKIKRPKSQPPAESIAKKGVLDRLDEKETAPSATKTYEEVYDEIFKGEELDGNNGSGSNTNRG